MFAAESGDESGFLGGQDVLEAVRLENRMDPLLLNLVEEQGLDPILGGARGSGVLRVRDGVELPSEGEREGQE